MFSYTSIMKKLFSILYVLIVQIVFAQNEQYNDVVHYYHSQKNFNGIVLVATNGQIDYMTGIGVSNRQAGTTMNAKAKFKIASFNLDSRRSSETKSISAPAKLTLAGKQ